MKINERLRKDIGDLAPLIKSIKEIGLIHPIVVDSKGVLIAGYRRLKACEELGIEPICRVVDFADPMRAEIDENVVRKDFTPGEIFEINGYYNRTISKQGSRNDLQLLSESDRSEHPREVVAKVTGVSTDTISKINTIFNSDNEEIKQKVNDEIISVDKAYKEIKKEEKKSKNIEQDKIQINMPDEIYDIIYCDPPWKYDFAETENRAIENHYPTMTVAQICEMQIPETRDDALLIMWATAPKLIEALDVIKAWGFTYVTNGIWDKGKIGMGYWFRGQHELLLIAKKGNFSPPEPEFRNSSIHYETRGKHSAKPLFYYDWIDKAYPYKKKIELFARNKMDNWSSWGNEL